MSTRERLRASRADSGSSKEKEDLVDKAVAASAKAAKRKAAKSEV